MEDLWFITGVSSGLGRALALAALAAGHRVVGTVRKATDLAEFEAQSPRRAIGLLLDVSDFGAIPDAIGRIEREIGPIGIVVNNAGFGQEGAIESIPIENLRKLYDANLFGPIAISQAVLPFMRSRGRGRIINISSVTPFVAAPALGAYSSSKAAMNCFSEVLAKEVAPFGVKVTAILAGSFRTDWAGRSLVRVADEPNEYAHLQEQREARARRNGTQSGDPAKFAQAVLDLAASDDPPFAMLLGDTTPVGYRRRIEAMEADMARLERATRTDFD